MREEWTPVGPKWVAELHHVREVSLRGSADLKYWRSRIEIDGWSPTDERSQAVVLLVAAAGRFRGIGFSELSVSIALSSTRSTFKSDAGYLLGAFNSNRCFAFFERTLFSTPYTFADVQIPNGLPPRLRVLKNGASLLRAAMDANLSQAPLDSPRAPSGQADEKWDGPVLLPRRPREKAGDQKCFFARLQGHTSRHPFLPERDELFLFSPSAMSPIHALLESGFTPREWIVRDDATHAKSRTYRIDRAPALEGEAPRYM